MRGLRISTQPIASSSGGVTIGIRMAAAEQIAPGQVGAFEQEAQTDRDHDGEGRAADREDQRVAYQSIGVWRSPRRP